MSCGYGSNLRLREFTREFQGDGTTSAHVQSRGGKPSKIRPGRTVQHSPNVQTGSAQVGATTMTLLGDGIDGIWRNGNNIMEHAIGG